MHTIHRIQALLAATLALGLVARGGGTPAAREEAGATDAERSTRAAAATTEADPIAALLDDDGAVMPSSPQAVPADAGARTRTMRYASAAQAEMVEHARPGGALRADVTGSGAEAVDIAVGVAHGLQAAANLGNDVPVFVRGADLRSTAAAADRLAAQGMTRVWLVTP